jgi:hypothetical protein
MIFFWVFFFFLLGGTSSDAVVRGMSAGGGESGGNRRGNMYTNTLNKGGLPAELNAELIRSSQVGGRLFLFIYLFVYYLFFCSSSDSFSSGWDNFGLVYHIKKPVSSIITNVAMNKYKFSFGFIWSLKRVDYALSKAWEKLTVFFFFVCLFVLLKF